ncbi:hypothetical protein Psuf_070610 [Phytohabitans suffuscus]|uniref:AB hydrolase-1 domain-containing protein n=1 Tax=Phytohabitans suffuscus TaxID=624315 RepID=A0A6F8YUY1_9ACTN|nr:alpha/beta hydrolase [Phytohabitans suffuscus]BCB89748.1 hypothetical protein Psuf_070610 [Phytohabitans suffuscus]
MTWGYVEDTRLYLTDAVAARKRMNQERDEFLFASALTRDGAPDGLGGYHQLMSSCRSAGLAPGVHGWWDDSGTQVRPWRFDLAGIAVPVLLMYGRRDIFVPSGHGEWLAARIPGVEARWFDGDGHGTLAQERVPEAHAWLSERR